jgi:hypothetical protein
MPLQALFNDIVFVLLHLLYRCLIVLFHNIKKHVKSKSYCERNKNGGFFGGFFLFKRRRFNIWKKDWVKENIKATLLLELYCRKRRRKQEE